MLPLAADATPRSESGQTPDTNSVRVDIPIRGDRTQSADQLLRSGGGITRQDFRQVGVETRARHGRFLR